MVLTVRLTPTLDAALERYCTDQGTTKSHVVHESLAAHLSRAAAAAPTRDAVAPSAAFLAFSRAGLIGGAALGPLSADKAAVRKRATQRDPAVK